MSGFIPMVSSSPPPMDDSGGFAAWDDDDDDFGNFTGADDSFGTTPAADFGKQKVVETSNGPVSDDNFADFNSFKPVENNADNLVTTNGEEQPSTVECTVEENSQTSLQNAVNGPDNGPLTDSGLYSSEVSPVPQFEDIPETSKSHTDTDSLDELSTDSSPRKSNLGKDVVDDVSGDIGDSKENKGDTIDISAKDDKEDEVNVSCGNINCQPVELSDDKTDVEACEAEPKQSDISVDTLPDDSLHSVVEHHEELDQSVDTLEHQNVIPSSDISSPMSTSKESECITAATSEQCSEAVSVPDSNAADSVLPEDLDEHVTDSHKCVDNSDEIKPHKDTTECNHIGSGDSVVNGDSISGDDFGDFIEKPVNIEESRSLSDNCDITDNEEVVSIEHNSDSQNYNKGSDQDSSSSSKTVHETTQDTENDSKDSEIGATSTIENDSNTCDSSIDESRNNSNVQNLDNNTVESEEKVNCASNISCEENVQFEAKESGMENVHEISEESNLESGQKEHLNTQTEESTEDSDNFGDFSSSKKKDFDTVSTSNKDDFGEFPASNDDGFAEFPAANNDDFGNFSTSNNDNFGNFSQVNKDTENETGAAKDSVSNEKVPSVDDDDDFGDFGEASDTTSQNNDKIVFKKDAAQEEFGEFGQPGDDNDDDFGDFGDATKSDGFADFGAAPVTAAKEEASDWASFSEPQTSQLSATGAEQDDDDWSAFDDDSTVQAAPPVAPSTSEASVPPQAQNLSKSEKIQYAVTACFPAVLQHVTVDIIDLETYLGNQERSREHKLWFQIKDLKTTDALEYQWSKSQWNSHLYTTLHVDTRNVLIGHKKAQVPIFASGLGLLEPTKGPVGSNTSTRSDVLVETSHTEQTNPPPQDNIIPPAEFDWTGSGLTNPLEASNKTLNLDFLIQDQAAKSNALECEFLEMTEPSCHKPSIQPLENILATMKVNSTFKPTHQAEDISQESQKIVTALPDLVFMTSKVLMFPIRMNNN